MKLKQQCVSFKNQHGEFCLKLNCVYNFDLMIRETGEVYPAYNLMVVDHTINFLEIKDEEGRVEYINKDIIVCDSET